jgi:hypothetical protein
MFGKEPVVASFGVNDLVTTTAAVAHDLVVQELLLARWIETIGTDGMYEDWGGDSSECSVQTATAAADIVEIHGFIDNQV